MGSRIIGLDGIRGLAALFVVFHHTWIRSFPGYPADHSPFWAGWMIYGRLAVDVFMVLSGFSLAVSPARHGWHLGGVGRFLRRRAWRILPPYWAALAFSLLIAWFVIPQPGGGIPNGRTLIVDGLLLQDWTDAPSPNRAFWTIAIEAHLYFVFPLLLLMIRRIGAAIMVAAVTGVVLVVQYTASAAELVRLTPEFAVLFAVGIVAARILTVAPARQSWPWHWIALAIATPVLALMAWKGSVWTIGQQLFWVQLALAPAIGCLLAALATGRPAPLVRLLDTAPFRRLGSFSYSLYLTHAPIVVIVYFKLIDGRFTQGVPSLLASLAIVVPATILVAWLFGSLFEIPFQRYRSWSAVRDASAARVRVVGAQATRLLTVRPVAARPRPSPAGGADRELDASEAG